MYGSVAKGTNKPESDIDILVIWKKCVPHNVHEIKQKIEKQFNKKIDFVSLIHKGKIMFDCDGSNIIPECISIFGDKCDIVLSKYIGKI